jgi:hypothetical protein
MMAEDDTVRSRYRYGTVPYRTDRTVPYRYRTILYRTVHNICCETWKHINNQINPYQELITYHCIFDLLKKDCNSNKTKGMELHITFS